MSTHPQGELRFQRIVRMHALAKQYHDAAEELASGRPERDRGATTALLSVLAFEIWLKCACFISTGKRPSGHNYRDLWSKLEGSLTQALLLVAQERIGPAVNFDNLDSLLDDWRKIFEEGRYEYEFGWDETDNELAAIGADWIANDAPLSEALLRYHPLELFCLNHALADFVEQELHGTQPA